jgi:hypothetical protein
MSFWVREVYKKVVRPVGGEGELPAQVMESVKNMLPNNKVVMGGPSATSSPTATSSSGTMSPRTEETSKLPRLSAHAIVFTLVVI